MSEDDNSERTYTLQGLAFVSTGVLELEAKAGFVAE